MGVLAVTPYGAHVWEWFWQLERARRALNGLEPLSHAELHAWALLYDVQPAPWEVDALFRMDAVRRETFADSQRARTADTTANKDPALARMVPFNAEGVRSMVAVKTLARSALSG